MDLQSLYAGAALLEMGARAKFAETRVEELTRRIAELESQKAELESKLNPKDPEPEKPKTEP